MNTATISQSKHKTLGKYVFGCFLFLMACQSPGLVYGQIVFSDTREEIEKEEMMQMFRKAKLISDTFYVKREDLYLLDIIYLGEDLYLFVNGYLDVYKWEYGNWKKLSLERKGGYNFGSKKFEWNNRIFSFGGYGFWRHHGELIEFDPESGIWKIIKLPVKLPNTPMYTTDFGFRIIGDTCYDVLIDKKTVKKIKVEFPIDIWSKDTYYGSKPESNLWAVLLLGGQKLFYDKKGKKLHYSELNTDAEPYRDLFKASDWVQFKNDSLINWSPDGNIISTLKISEMVKLYKRFEVDEKKNNGLRMLGYITLIFGLIASITFWKIRKRKQAYQGESWQNDLISHLLNAKISDINTEQLDRMLGIDEITPLEYRKYRRSRIIHEINEEFNIKFGKDLISRYKDPEDGRRYLYKIGNTEKTINSA